MELSLVGIGTGNPEHLTLQAIRALKAADLIIVPRKSGKDDLAELRLSICAELAPNVALREFDLPSRDPAEPDYAKRVNDWHDAIAEVWAETIGDAERVALLVWGDPSLYDSTLRIAARLTPAPKLTVVPGITSIQALTAAHAIPLNDINALAEVCEPGTVVIAMGQVNDVRLFRDLVASGIQDYLLKPVFPNQVRDVLHRYRDAWGLRNIKQYRGESRTVRQWIAMAAREQGMQTQ